MKFRKKPVVIEAVQWTGYNDEELMAFIGDRHSGRGRCGHNQFLIFTLEGVMKADVGDWIIEGVQGEHYPCKPDIFEATYDSI